MSNIIENGEDDTYKISNKESDNSEFFNAISKKYNIIDKGTF